MSSELEEQVEEESRAQWAKKTENIKNTFSGEDKQTEPNNEDEQE